MLAFLLDEQISHVVAEQLRQKQPDIGIETVLLWRNGDLRGKADALVLAAAYEAALTLVTYDQKTISPLLMEFATNGEHHSGVVFVDCHTIASENIGALTQALMAFFDRHHTLVGTDVVMFLKQV